MLNPMYHATTRTKVQRYKVEPFAVCADVYGAAPHVGRGGWTWYTGSASWLYRVGLEAMLGFRLTADTLRIEPCVPPTLPRFQITYRHGSATYRIRVDCPSDTRDGVRSVTVDGRRAPGGVIALRDDASTHELRIAWESGEE
jgi:cellobiose phosphorylase